MHCKLKQWKNLCGILFANFRSQGCVIMQKSSLSLVRSLQLQMLTAVSTVRKYVSRFYGTDNLDNE